MLSPASERPCQVCNSVISISKGFEVTWRLRCEGSCADVPSTEGTGGCGWRTAAGVLKVLQCQVDEQTRGNPKNHSFTLTWCSRETRQANSHIMTEMRIHVSCVSHFDRLMAPN